MVIYVISKEHEADLRSDNQTYALVKHWEEVHQTMTPPPKYSYTLLKTHKTALDRQVWEGVYISFEKSDHILNGKGEWGMNLFPQLRSHQDIINEGTETSLQSGQDKLSSISCASSNSQKRSRDDRVIANHCVSNTGATILCQDSMS